MKRSLVLLALATLTLSGCSKFLPAAMHHQAKTTAPAPAATSGATKPANPTAQQTGKPAADAIAKPTAAHKS